MPIRLNLLAEAQAAEELRRRDPVKRAIWAGGVLVAGMLVWSAYLQLQDVLSRRDLHRLQGQLAVHTNEYQQVREKLNKTSEIKQKLGALRELTTNRFLHATLLNALQQTALDDLRLTRMRVDQSYTLTEETKPRTNGNRVLPGKPATITEKVVLTLDAKDSGNTPGDQVNKFKESIINHPYFQRTLGKTNELRLTNLSAPLPSPEGRPFVLFTLECRYPERTR